MGSNANAVHREPWNKFRADLHPDVKARVVRGEEPRSVRVKLTVESFPGVLRTEHIPKTELESAVSSLRSRLKLDCGIYSTSEARRPLKRPRPAPWTANPSIERTSPGKPM